MSVKLCECTRAYTPELQESEQYVRDKHREIILILDVQSKV